MKSLADVMPLSPLQEGLLFHALYDESVDVYQAQLTLRLSGPLNVPALRSAATALIARHTALRTGFRHRRDGQPVQVVYDTAPLLWTDLDLSARDQAGRERELETCRAADRIRRFSLERPPLLRFTLVRLGPGAHCLMITAHHAALDGWSTAILTRELFTLYARDGDPAALPDVTSAREYHAWLRRQDRKAALAAWQRSLHGLDQPTLVAPEAAARVPGLPGLIPVPVRPGTSAALRDAGRRAGLTANTLVQGAWGLLLAQLTGRRDVVFGALVSGRPPEIPGVDRMVGMFINALPVRMRVRPGLSVLDTLAGLQREQAALMDCQHVGLEEIQRAAGLGTLYDTFTVFENYPGDTSDAVTASGLRIEQVSGYDAAHYPLRLIAGLAGEELRAKLEYRPDVYSEGDACELARRLAGILDEIATSPGRAAAELARRAGTPGAVRPPAPETRPTAGGTPPDDSAPDGSEPGGGLAGSPLEEILCGMYADILRCGPVGVNDSFFDLGGQSLSAVRLLSQVRSVLGKELPVRAVFETPSVRELAARIEAGSGRLRPELTPRPRSGRIPLSFAQQRLWFAHQAENAGSLYNVPVTLRLRGDLNVSAMRDAIGDVMARHEALRTVFPVVSGDPHQKILPPEEARPVLEIARVGRAELAKRAREAARYEFDLAAEPPVRAWLFTLSGGEHVLLLLVHHVATDGWSSGPLLRDLSRAYSARQAGTAPAWPSLPVQYADYALWQRELLGADDDPDSRAAHHLRFWRDHLAGLPGRLELPFSRPGSPAGSAPDLRGGTVPFQLDATAHAALAALARKARATVFMTVQAGVAALLTRLGAGTDIPLGTVTAGRPDTALNDLVGFFVNPLVLRTDTSGDPSFAKLLARVRDADLLAYSHQDLPFEQIVHALNPARDGGHPLFQVMLAFQGGGARPEFAGLRTDAVRTETGQARLDLAFNLRELRREDGTPDGIEGIIEYSANRIDAETAGQLADRLARLLAAAGADPEAPISAAGILVPGELERLTRYGSGPAAGTSPRTLAELFEAQAERTPDAEAVRSGERSLTYAELNARANALARQLIRRGAGPERLVALCLPRSSDLIASVLAVAKTGAAWLSVDTQYPPQRIELMLRDAGQPLVVTVADAARSLPLDGADPVLLNAGCPGDGRNVIDSERISPLHVDNPAYVIYTSGSTGRPRGVVVSHRGLAGLAASQNARYAAGPGSRILQFVSPGFDVFVSELCLALLSGGCLVMPGQAAVGADLARMLEEWRITHVMLPAAVLAGLPRVPLPRLRTLVTGGEACLPEVADFWARDRRLVIAYGPTETTVEVSLTVRRPGQDDAQAPLGRPIGGVRLYVLDAALRPVPPGVTGELYVSAPGLARGYLNSPSATALRFVASPFRPGERLHRTGDLAWWRPDGQLEFAGRADGQVKIRGFRVEPGEVESALRRQPGVTDAAVIVRDDPPRGRELVAYVVPRDGADPGSPGTGNLRSALAAELPGYLVPAAVVAVARLPLTANGKLDRGALPAPPSRVKAQGRAPRSPREQLLCDLFREVTGEEAGPEDNFFELGGHSLTAARLAGRVNDLLGTDLPVAAVFGAQTPAALASLTEPGDASRRALGMLLPLRQAGDRPPLFCVHPVGGMSWRYTSLLAGLGPAYPVYGLQAEGLDGTGEPPRSLEEMVTRYAERIRGVQPSGPYHLLGWSLGGNIAHALAARLQRDGCEVSLLALLDAYPMTDSTRGRVSGDRMLATMHSEYARIYGQPGDPVPEPGDGVPLRRAIAALLGRGRSELRHLPDEQRAAIVDVMARNVHLVAGHDPALVQGDLLFVAAGKDAPADSAPGDWEPFIAGAVTVHTVAASHPEMLDQPAAGHIAALLRDRIRYPHQTISSQENPTEEKDDDKSI